ncbi:MAG: hypothetical protein KA758_14400 [Acidimicrobiales bacterium]|nr:hypothetical protein [Acidimicrobiales bacterium]
MSIIKKSENPYDLSEAEIAFLKSTSQLDPEVRTYLSRQHENLGTKTSAFRKIAAAANAEADALLGVKRLAVARGEMTEVGEARRIIESKDGQIRALEAQRDRAKAETLRVKAIPAQVVHSGGE